MHWAGALSFGGASRGFVSLLEKWLYHGIIAPCGSFQTWSLALKLFHHYVQSFCRRSVQVLLFNLDFVKKKKITGHVLQANTNDGLKSEEIFIINL